MCIYSRYIYIYIYRKYGPPVLNVPYKYAMSVFILFFTTFYLPIFPLGVPFGLIALGTHYWANKVNIFLYTNNSILNIHILFIDKYNNVYQQDYCTKTNYS